jgi:type I restriction enzyme S subunit
MAKKKLTIEEKLQAALVPAEEQPYKVPENWCWVKLGAVITASKEKQDVFDSETKYVGLEHIEKDTGNISFAVADGVKSTKSVFKCGDILYGKLRPYLNKHGIVDFDGVCSTDILVFNAIEGDNRLYDFYFSLPHFIEYAVSNSKGINLPRVSEKVILEIPFPMSPQDEQSRIVARIESLFAKLDEAKEKIQEVLDGADLRRAAILHQAFTGKLTEKWRRENSVGDESWEFTNLGNICHINPKKIDTTNLDDNMEVSFIPMADVSDISGEVIGNQTRTLGEVKKGFTNFNEGDVVFAKITPCMENGKSAIIGKLKNNVGYGTTEFYVLRPKEVLYNRYVYHFVRSKFFRDKAKSNMTGAVGQQRVPKKFMQEYEINLPSMPEQQEIVRLLDNLLSREQSTVTACEEALTTIDTLKKSILARAFRGELGTNDPADPSAKELLREILSA